MTTRTKQRTEFLADVLEDCIGNIGHWARMIDSDDQSYTILEVGDGDLNPTGKVFVDRTLIGDFNLTGFEHVVTVDSIDRGLDLLMEVEWGVDHRALTAGKVRHHVEQMTSAVIANLTDGAQGSISPIVLELLLQYSALGGVKY